MTIMANTDNSAKKEKKARTTLQKYTLWHRWSIALEVTKYAMPAIPFGVILGINWSDWFGNNESQGWSIGVGFGMLIVSTVMAIVEIMKKDEIAKTNVSMLYYISIVFVLVGFSFKLLASIANEFGDMFLYVSCGIVGSGCVDQVNKAWISKKAAFYKKLVEDNELDDRIARKIAEQKQAEKEGQYKKKNRNYL